MMQNKSKILMVGPDINSQGGISSVIKMYKDYGLNISTLASYKDGNALAKLFVYGLFLVKYIVTLAVDKNVKLVHLHTASRGSFIRKSIAFKLAKLFHKKVIIHIHGAEFELFYNESPKFIKEIITKTLNDADLVIVLSKQWKDTIARISTSDKIKVLYNPTVIKVYSRIHSESTKAVFMGRLGKRKGIYDVIESAKLIKNPNVEINLYGDGEIEKFDKLISDSDLHDKIKLPGWVSGEKKDEVLQNSDIFILPSYNEGLPMSILEAMAVGLPIISTPVGGIPEAVEDGVNGFLIQAGDYNALAEKIDLLASNQSLRVQMGQRGYNLAKEKFDIKIIIKQLQDIYDELLG
jgi:glycosyltransferase involved in cell wall biosynthesis